MGQTVETSFEKKARSLCGEARICSSLIDLEQVIVGFVQHPSSMTSVLLAELVTDFGVNGCL